MILIYIFQSTHPRRVRQVNDTSSIDFTKFQSTHPRRVRLQDVFDGMTDFMNFNPRTREGCDGMLNFFRL